MEIVIQKTYNTRDSYRRQIEELSRNRSQDEKELQTKFEKLEASFDQYEVITGFEYKVEDK